MSSNQQHPSHRQPQPDPAQQSQERIDAAMAQLAEQRANERALAEVEAERRQEAADRQEAAERFTGWHKPLVYPNSGNVNPGVLPEGYAPPQPGTLTAYAQQDFLSNLFAAAQADPGNSETLRALVFELARMVASGDITSRSRGLPH